MNLSTIVALLTMVATLLGKSAGTPAQGQAIAMANQVIAVAEQWVSENPTNTPSAPTGPSSQPITNQSDPSSSLPPVQTPPPISVVPPPIIVPPLPVASTTSATTTPVEMVRVDNGSALSSAGVQSDYACTMKTCHWDIAQAAQLGSWNISAPDASTLTGVTINIDPALAPYVEGVQVYVGSQPWQSADGVHWTSLYPEKLPDGAATYPADLGPTFETSVLVQATLLPGETAPFNAAATIGEFQGTDNVTGANINQ